MCGWIGINSNVRIAGTRGGRTLVSYGPSVADLYRQAAAYVDKILRDAVPGDLAVEQPSKLELVITLQTAKALGLAIPKDLLLRADEVIQQPSAAG